MTEKLLLYSKFVFQVSFMHSFNIFLPWIFPWCAVGNLRTLTNLLLCIHGFKIFLQVNSLWNSVDPPRTLKLFIPFVYSSDSSAWYTYPAYISGGTLVFIKGHVTIMLYYSVNRCVLVDNLAAMRISIYIFKLNGLHSRLTLWRKNKYRENSRRYFNRMWDNA